MQAKRIFYSICFLAVFALTAVAQKVPVISDLKEVAQLPDKVPQRVMALAFDGKKLWFAIYLDRGRYVKYDPQANEWDLEQDEQLNNSIRGVTRTHMSAGGMVFVDGKMWLGSAYGDFIGWIDLDDPARCESIQKRYKRDLSGSQSYSDLTTDGTYIWAAWHSFNWKMDRSQTQLLLKIDKANGDVLAEYPLPPGSSSDGTHALAWDGSKLWHAKGSKLTSLDENGVKMGQFDIPTLKRPSGMVWDGNSLWIVEFDGKLWRLPFKTIP